MTRTNTLRENIEWLLTQYKRELELEEQKDIEEQNLDVLNDFKNVICELECALEISK